MKIHEEQLMRMKMEFYQDEHGKIWLFNVSDIWVRITKGGNPHLFQTSKSPLAVLKKLTQHPEPIVTKHKKEKLLVNDEINKAVDKELEDLVFLHKNQMGKKVNIDELRREVSEIKKKAESEGLQL